MLISNVSQVDRTTLQQCVVAAADGPFFDDIDFGCLFRVDRKEARSLAATIGGCEELSPAACSVISSSLLNLLAFPHNKGDLIGDWISVSISDIKDLANRWYSLLPKIQYKTFTVHGPILFQGKFYRVIEHTTSAGGHGYSSQVWCRDQWVHPLDGPGCPEIMRTTDAPRDQLLDAGVDISPLPASYDPHAIEDA